MPSPRAERTFSLHSQRFFDIVYRDELSDDDENSHWYSLSQAYEQTRNRVVVVNERFALFFLPRLLYNIVAS